AKQSAGSGRNDSPVRRASPARSRPADTMPRCRRSSQADGHDRKVPSVPATKTKPVPPDRLPMSLRYHAQGRRVALLAFQDQRSMAMHTRFPRLRPLALSLLLACGAGASLPAMAGITCIVQDSDTGTQDNGGADTVNEDERSTACGKNATAGLTATALGTNAEAT